MGSEMCIRDRLGVVSEQFPKGGALTLNAIAGIGMLAVGIIGGPLIGKMQEDTARVALTAQDSAVYEKISKDDSYFSIPYKAVDGMKVAELDELWQRKSTPPLHERNKARWRRLRSCRRSCWFVICC